MKRVLIITYDFPPSSIGIWRTLKFCHYMPEFGWEPVILTVKPVRSPRQDSGPLAELPPGTAIHRTGSLDPFRLAWIAGRAADRLRGGGASGATAAPSRRPTSAPLRAVMDVLRRWVLAPDDKVGWLPFAARAGRRLARGEHFDALYTTSFPNTAHLAGLAIARSVPLPWLADFRDIWIGNYSFHNPPTAWHARFERRLEAAVVRRAGAVVSATEPITRDFLERHPGEDPAKFSTITNGFDPPDFEGPEPVLDREHFTITYVGTMYGSTSPEHFLRAVRALLDAEPRWAGVLRLRFVGTMIEPYRAMIDAFGLGPVTRLDPYLAHGEALAAMKAADVLLLLVAPVEGAHIMLTQKVLEYAGARRPVLGLVPEGAARDFLAEIGEGPIVHPADTEAIGAALRGLLEGFEQGGRRELGPNAALARYERRGLTGRLCGLLDGLAGSAPARR